MRLKAVLLLAFFGGAGLGFAQPCTPAYIVNTLPPPHFTGIGFVTYGMGFYFRGEDPLHFQVSQDLVHWSRVTPQLRTPLREGQEYLGTGHVFYANGSWVEQTASRLLASRDGLHWEETYCCVGPWGGYDLGLYYDGRRWVRLGFWGDILLSNDGFSWEEGAIYPGVYPVAQAAVTHLGMSVTDRNRWGDPGYATTNYRDWWQPAALMANGWFWKYGFEGQGERPTWVARTRDGKSWRYVPQEPEETVRRPAIAGRKYYLFSFKGENGEELKLMLGGKSRHIRFAPGQDVPWDIGLSDPGNSAPFFDGRWLFATAQTMDKNLKPGNDVLVRFACAEVGEPMVLPGMAHQEGALGTKWQSDLVLSYHATGGSEVRVEWLPYGQPNPEPRFARLWINLGETRVIRDVVKTLFGAEGNGAIRVVWLGPGVGIARGRTYNAAASGTFGQEIPSFSWEDGAEPAHKAWLEGSEPVPLDETVDLREEEIWVVGLEDSARDDAGFRTNFGIQNLWVEPAEVEVVWLASDGRELGRRQVRLGALEGVQWFRPLRELGQGPLSGVTALVRLFSPNTRIVAYASVVDNRTGDGQFVPGVKRRFEGSVPLPFERQNN
jgi:hypothetical protein